MALLDGTTALITGGGSGIGLACARALIADGARVTLMGRSADRLAAACKELGDAASAAPGDVADEADVSGAVEQAAAGGSLDIAVLAAGTGGGGPIPAIARESWDSIMAVNVTGAFLAIKHAVPKMTAGGAIVAISSIAAPLTHRFMAPYCVSKAALEALVRNAADELGAQGIRVNAVRPGLVPTELAAPLASNEGIVADYLAQMPISRLGTPEDVAAAVRYLAGPESGWVTGQCFAVDGGHTLRRGPDLLAGS